MYPPLCRCIHHGKENMTKLTRSSVKRESNAEVRYKGTKTAPLIVELEAETITLYPAKAKDMSVTLALKSLWSSGIRRSAGL